MPESNQMFGDSNLHHLVSVAQAMASTFELDPLLQTVEQEGRTALNCERATIFLFDSDKNELYSKIATGASEIRFSAERGIAGEAARTRSTVVVPDAYADERFNPEIDKKTGYRTRNMLTLPMVTPDGELIGVMQVLNKIDDAFDANDEELAMAFGALTGVAIKRQMLMDEAAAKQRLERDLNIARDIQQRSLPQRQLDLPGFDVAGWNKPADETGGDCYDFHMLEDGRLSVMIADATGHGIGPALIVLQCRSLIRAMAHLGEGLPKIAQQVNHLLCEDLPADRFVTACFGLLDLETRELNYISAGQGPLFHYQAASDTVHQYIATGLPMGILEDGPYELGETIRFEPGDMFLLMTDGFIEWCRHDGEQFGDERLAELLRLHKGESSEELIRTIHRSVLEFSAGSPQADDLTALLIKCTG
jgi:phosphoserine phosphatase